MAIGDSILDIGATLEAGLFAGAARDAAEAAVGPVLNPLLALPAIARTALRRRLSDILAADSDVRGMASRLLHDAADCEMHLPARSAVSPTSSPASTTRSKAGRFYGRTIR